MVSVKIVKTDLLKNLENAINSLNKKVGKVGWFKDAKYDDDKQTQVAEVAATHEYGYPSKNIPARPFLKPTILNKGNEWKDIALKRSKSVILGKITAEELLEEIGQKSKEDIAKTIEGIWSPPLRPATINARIRRYSSDPELKESTRKIRKRKLQKFISTGLYKPLEDTGHMLSTLINVVEDE